MDILEVIWADEDVVSRDQVHHSKERRTPQIARDTSDDPRLEIYQHGIAETFRHECHLLIFRRDVCPLAKMREHLDIRGQMLERIARLSFALFFGRCGDTEQCQESQKNFHATTLYQQSAHKQLCGLCSSAPISECMRSEERRV